MVKYRLSGEGYTDEEMRVLKHMCKDTLADINEFMRKKEEKKKKERKEKKKIFFLLTASKPSFIWPYESNFIKYILCIYRKNNY